MGCRGGDQRDFESLFQAAMRNIHAPTLLVRGKLSDVMTEEGVQEFLMQIPGAKLADVGGATHIVAGDQNDAFSQAVVESLQRDVRPTFLIDGRTRYGATR